MNVLSINLNTTSVSLTALSDPIVHAYLGGRGTNTKLFFDLTGPKVDSLSGDCPIIFGTGPLTGTPFPMSGRFEATSKSPLTNTIFTSSCGGRLGVHLKRAGIDTLVLKGAAKQPSYILVDKGDVRVINGQDLWGKDKTYVKQSLKGKHGAGISVLLIGKAGENRLPFSNIENDGRFLGRGGLGAVLGAKNVKAIVARGTGKVPIADRESFDFLSYECKKWLSANPVTARGLPQFGTGILLNFMREAGLLWTRNSTAPAPFESSALSGEMVTASVLTGRRACPFCPVACGRVTMSGHGPEYETLWSLGVNLGIFDLEKVVHLNDLCNELGLDTVSMGAVLGMAMELSDTGRLPVKLGYGDFESVRQLILDTAAGEGTGNLLSLGAKRLGEIFDAPKIAPHVKGLELPAYDPRGAFGHALGYATSNRGGCHMQGYLIGAEVLGLPKMVDRFAIEGKASLLALYQNVSAFMDTLVMCRFSSFAMPHDYYARFASAVTGRKISWQESITIGERVWNLERLINIREGVEKDCLPGRFRDVPIDDLLREYYEVRGWNNDGMPTQETLNKLGLL
jgi:aldehyde:ferredoxin oxidoreductase